MEAIKPDPLKLEIFRCDVDLIFYFAVKDNLPKDKVEEKILQTLKDFKENDTKFKEWQNFKKQ